MCLVLALGLPSRAETVTVVEDHFNDGVLDQSWDITFRNAYGWSYAETGTQLVVTDILTTADRTWTGVTLGQDCPSLGDFHADFDIAWDCEASVRAMQSLFVLLRDPNGDRVVSAGFRDAWVANPGSYYAWIAGNEYPPYVWLPLSGSALIDIDRVGELITVRWNGSVLMSGTSASPIQRVEILFNYYPYSYWQVSFFGRESVDLIHVEGEPLDSDGDGLNDYDEANLGTDPHDPDTDDDDLLDGVEVDIADGSGCPDPLDSDSDDDNLLDGEEVDVMGTDSCNPDTDEDGVPDDVDPLPTDPGVTGDYIEQALRDLSERARSLDLSLIDAPNENSARGRRNALGNKVNAAANAAAHGDYLDAIEQLASLHEKVDGEPAPADWMLDCTDRDEIRTEVEELIALLAYLL
ncbi:MAG: hypothetical protein ACYS0G_08965 [Planctomycetota bacterium]